jgi:diacylglycerol kinase family enzyme
MRVTIIQNPHSGEGALTGAEFVTLAAAAGHKATYASTEDPAVVTAALAAPADLVAIAGGDGTIRDVARRLIGTNVVTTIVPTGTANNLAKTLGISGEARDLVQGWEGGTIVPFDTAIVRGCCGPRVMFEGAGLGPIAVTIAALTPVTPREARPDRPEDELRRDLKVMREILADYPAHECQVTLDGRDLSGRYLAIQAMNIPSIGPNVRLAPDADWSDGCLDLVLVGPGDRMTLREYLTARIDERHPPLALPVQRGRALHIGWRGSRVHVDDEVWPSEEDAARGAFWPRDALLEMEIVMNPAPLQLLIPRQPVP